MVIIKNSHDPLITQEIWDKCREVDASVSQGKKTKKGETMPLSGFLFCAECGTRSRSDKSSDLFVRFFGYGFKLTSITSFVY